MLAAVVSVQAGSDSDEQLNMFKAGFALHLDHVEGRTIFLCLRVLSQLVLGVLQKLHQDCEKLYRENLSLLCWHSEQVSWLRGG